MLRLPEFVKISHKVSMRTIFPAVKSIAGKKVKVVGRVETPKGPAYRVEAGTHGITQILVGFCDPCDSSGRSVPII